MKRIKYCRIKLLAITLLLLHTINARATDDPPIVKVFSGAAGDIAPDPFGLIADAKEVVDGIFYNLNSTIENPVNDKITNAISLLIDEDQLEKLGSTDNSFTAWVRFKIDYTLKNGTTGSIASHQLEVSYKKGEGINYNPRQTFKFDNCRKVKITILETGGAGANIFYILRLENRMLISRDYVFNYSSPANLLPPNHTVPGTEADELKINWSSDANIAKGKTHIDIEWTWIDKEAISSYKTGSVYSADLIFLNNSSRVTIDSRQANFYEVPLIYDGTGYLFYRVRPVQYKESGQVVNGEWSTHEGNFTFIERIAGEGHEESLNWQTTTSFAEEGKRKTVVQYFDGTLRGRQTVTKDNVTNKTVVAETFYDYQGRPAINILPAPTMNSVIQFTADFNKFAGSFVTPKDAFDLMPPNAITCNFLTPKLDKDNVAGGAAVYYSPNNPEKVLGLNKFIPDANGYAYSETRYTPDATGRIAVQGGVGETHQIGKGNTSEDHDTKYFYSKPDQKELDALFGNEAGDASHYFKNMVRDANGQYSVSYVDMHGRTVATALAGNVPDNLKALSSYSAGVRTLEKDLLTPLINRVEGRSVVSSTTLPVTQNGVHSFHYELTPLSAEILACKPPGEQVCYDCYYDLEIRITGGCSTNIVKTATNLSFSGGVPQTDMSCSTSAGSIILNFDETLSEGEYDITKILTVSKPAQDWYRDNLFNVKNICRDLKSFYDEIYAVLLASSPCTITCAQCTTALGTYAQYRTAFLTQQGVNPNTVVPYEAEIDKSYRDAQQQCDAICAADKKNVLGSIRQAMLQDMTPDEGQYARLDVDLDGINGIDNSFNANYGRYEKYSNKPYNIFKAGSFPFRNPVSEDGQPFYFDELGRPDIVTDLIAMSPETFTQQFKSSWANSLISKHPEYCKLKKAETSLTASYARDARNELVETWAQAATAGYTDNAGTGIMINDEFFNGVGAGYKNTMIQYINDNYNRLPANFNFFPPRTNTLWKAAWMAVFCQQNNTTSCAQNAPDMPGEFENIAPDNCGDWDYVWRIFRTLYLSEKDRMVNLWLDEQCGNIASTLNAYKYEIRFGKPEDYYNNIDYLANIIEYANDDEPGNAQEVAQEELNEQYAENCESYKRIWISQLMQCDQIASKPQVTRDAINTAIVNGLKDICIEGSDVSHPMGSSTVKPGSVHVPTSFQAVITSVFSTYSISVSALCHPDMIDFPQPYDKQIPVGDEVVWEAKDECVCARLTTLTNEKNSMGIDPGVSLSSFILSQHGITISQTLIDQLLTGCSGSCTFYKEPVKIPAFLSCNTPLKNCIDCNEYDSLKAIFVSSFPPLSASVLYAQPQNDNELNANKAFAKFMNNRTGFNKTWYEYLAFENICHNSLNGEGEGGEALMPAPARLCTTETMFPQIEIPDECNSYLPTLAYNMAVEQYEVYLQQQKDEFENTYLNKCLEARNHEIFTVNAPVAEYHYTLYYYDQAGNLVKTVPPAGVIANFTTQFLADVKEAREDPEATPVLVEHNLQTQYRYNSLNQVIAQHSPDGGFSQFWYDALGRLVVSRNAKQATEFKYSYTRYDELGRINEVGEKVRQFHPMTQSLAQGTGLESWLAASASNPKLNITKTVYDIAYEPICTDNYLCQQNLRNRVAYSYLQNEDKGTTPSEAPWASASFYSYDIHGNVDILLQDYNESLGDLPGGNRYKKMVYQYDLLSGKVNEVAYQPGFADAFYHRYSYDAENKLTTTLTSKDYAHWATDASYFYYRHGPLARTITGELQVQGTDYAYTLQGWLKGVNSTGLKSGTITGDGEDCDGTGGFENLLVNARLNPYTSVYKAKHSIEFIPGFESNLPDNFETILDPALDVCGVNGTTGGSNESADDEIFDMGQDGSAGTNSYPFIYGNKIKTRDAYGFSLNYFNGDYNRINSASPNPFTTIDMALSTGDAGNGQTAQPLYNGNIGAMAVSIPKLSGTRVYGYNYDQLHRITNMHAFKGVNSSTNIFTPVALTDYKEKISYDANGNILTYRRNGINAVVPGGAGGLDMDDLAYEYYVNTNKLKRVTDNPANSTNYPGDIDHQADAENYVYDAIGNLVQDKAEGITDIEWNVYGKIVQIEKTKNGVSSTIYYTYDASGNRISKRVEKSTTDVTTYYVRDASGNVMSVYEKNNESLNNGELTQTEIHLYGSSRLGIYNVKTNVETESRQYITMSGVTGGEAEVFSFARGQKYFELINHLGNVLLTVSDKRMPVVNELSNICEGDICYSPLLFYSAEVVTATDYYPFGMLMPGRSFSSGKYRYGFNGQEKSLEINLNSYTAEFWEYDSRLGKRWNVDPVVDESESPYAVNRNNPMVLYDPQGDCPDCPTRNTHHPTDNTGLDPSGKIILMGESGKLHVQHTNFGDEKNPNWRVTYFFNEGENGGWRWNDEKKAFLNTKGEEFSNGLPTKIFNKLGIGVGKDFVDFTTNITTGQPLKDTRMAYNTYLEQNNGEGTWVGFGYNGVKANLTNWWGDMQAGGGRRTDALIGFWNFTSNASKGSTFSIGSSTTGVFRVQRTGKFLQLDEMGNVAYNSMNGNPKTVYMFIGSYKDALNYALAKPGSNIVAFTMNSKYTTMILKMKHIQSMGLKSISASDAHVPGGYFRIGVHSSKMNGFLKWAVPQSGKIIKPK